jgi:hypothetical protein
MRALRDLQLVRGLWMPAHNELLRPSFATKACLIASLIFVLDKQSFYITAPHDIVYLVECKRMGI